MGFEQYELDYWCNAADLEDLANLTEDDITRRAKEVFISRKNQYNDYQAEGWRSCTYAFEVFDNRLHVVNLDTGELLNYADQDGNLLVEFDACGYPSIVDNILRNRSAEDADSSRSLTDIANILGDKHNHRLYNGLENYADTLNKSNFKKLMQLCLNVHRRNTVFLKRDVLCDMLSTTPKHLNRVLTGLVDNGFIKVERAAMEAHTLKIQVNPCFVWKGYASNRSSAMYHQGFKPIAKKLPATTGIDWDQHLQDELAAFEEWLAEQKPENNGIDATMIAEIHHNDVLSDEALKQARVSKKLSIVRLPMNDVLFLGDTLFKENYQHWLKVVKKAADKVKQPTKR